jgi:HlyD family secretion protein
MTARPAQPIIPLGMTLAAVALLFPACKKETAQVVYRAVPVEQRDIVVSAQAAGAIQPDTTVEVKSKASGEILQLFAETGQLVKRGARLVSVDPRNARNALAQAQADLDVARAQLANATSQKRRSDELYKSQSITEQEHEQAQLDFANASAAVVRAKVSVDNAKIQLEDTDVRAPVTGTIIEKDVERGAVIASATTNVSGGTTLLKMANLDLVQVRSLVDETDVGKVQPGQAVTVTVDAYPNRTFEGTVLKIEPQAQTEQNVTVFPVAVRIQNKEGLLRPGMNTEVEIHIGQRLGVPAVPNAALRTSRDVGSAAQVLGLSAEEVQRELAASSGPSASSAGASPPAGVAGSAGRDSLRRGSARDSTRVRPDSAGRTQGQFRGTGGGGGAARRDTDVGGGRYVVFAKRNGVPTPQWIRTGLTDLDYSEVVQGLRVGDSVYVLPSASLIQSQQDMKNRVNQITGGGGVPGMRQQQPGGAAGGAGGAAPRSGAGATPGR